MKLQQWGSCLAMIGLLSFWGCTLKSVEPTEDGRRDTRNGKVLIATQKSEFKRSVVSEIKDNLGDNVAYVRVVDVRWLPNETPADFNAIVILNRCMAGRPDPRVETFIDELPDKNKVIVLTTGRLDSWLPDSTEVDAMTSASTMSATSPVARSIADKVLDIIDSQPE
jgi:hypothetical protein